MNWLTYVIINVLSDSTRIYVDNYISDTYFKERGAASQRFFYGFAYILLAIIVALCSGLDLSSAPMSSLGLFCLSGFITGIASIPYYSVLEKDNSTNLGIFLQLAPVLYLIFGWLFLGDTISPMQFLSFAIILSAPLLIIATSRKRSRNVRLKAMGLASLYVIMDIISSLLFVHANTPSLNLGSEIAVFFFGSGIGNLFIMLLYPKWIKRFHRVLKESKNKILFPITIGFLLNAVKSFSYRVALALAPAIALASVTSDATEPIVIFFMGIVLTLIWPKFGREKLDKKTVLVPLLATVIVVVGIILMQF